jgi:hypothetical protein
MKVEMKVTYMPEGPIVKDRMRVAGQVLDLSEEEAFSLIKGNMAWFPDSVAQNLRDATALPKSERSEYLSSDEIAFLNHMEGGEKNASPAIARDKSGAQPASKEN